MRRRGGGDPGWITVKFVTPQTICGGCKKKLVKGERVFYYPNSRTMFCMKDECGIKESNSFNAARFDEAQMSGSW